MIAEHRARLSASNACGSKYAAKRKEIAMDMKKYAGSHFIKFEDIRDTPRMETIASVSEGKYSRAGRTFRKR